MEDLNVVNDSAKLAQTPQLGRPAQEEVCVPLNVRRF